jgi:hypothetical protein
MKLTGNPKACEGCGLAKAKQKAVLKTTNLKADKPRKRFFVDTAGPYPATIGGSRYWVQIVDRASCMGFTAFVKKNTQLSAVVRTRVDQLATLQMITKYLRIDNAGENVEPLKELGGEQKFSLEHTAPDTPQQNGVVEQQIALLGQQAMAMTLDANFDGPSHNILWAEAVDCAIDLENITASTKSKVPAFELMTGKKSRIYLNLIHFG